MFTGIEYFFQIIFSTLIIIEFKMIIIIYILCINIQLTSKLLK